MDISSIGKTALESFLDIAIAIPSFLSAFFSALFSIASWTLWFITHFWIVFGLIEIGIMGISMQKQSFMEKISELISLHKRVYYDVIFNLLLTLTRLMIRVINTIGNYIPFT